MPILSQPARSLCPLIARGSELEALVRLWRSSRLVTLYGQSGVGKSALALAAAETLAEETGGCVVCRDTSRADGAFPILRLLAGMRRRAPGSTVDQGEGPLFVLLDDLPVAAHSAANGLLQWLVIHPDAHLLVVSRRPLQLVGEQTLALKPLAVTTGSEGVTPALQFFQHCARRARPGGPPLDDETAALIATELDGLPAALEAAASLAGALPQAEIVRIAREDPLSLTLRGTSLRTRLAATLADLPVEARDYLLANGEWPGSFSHPAAAHLWGQGSPATATACLIQLGLLEIVDHEPQLRYRLPRLVRRAAAEMSSPASAERKERLARYLLSQAERLSSDGFPRLIADELSAMRWAWRWLAGAREGETVLRFARALAGPLRHHQGDPLEAAELLQCALAWARIAKPEAVPEFASQLAATETWLGRLDAAESRLRALLEGKLPPDEAALARMRLAAVLASRGRHAQAAEARLAAIGSLRAARSDGDCPCGTVRLAWALHGLAEDRRRLGDGGGARAALVESETLFHRLECPYGRSAVLATQAALHADQQELEDARWHAREAHQLAERAEDAPGRASALQVLGQVTGQGDPAAGLSLLAEAAAVWERLRRPLDHATALLDTAELASAGEGSREPVLKPARAALQLARQHGFPAVEALALTLLAEAYHRLGQSERAEEYAAAARRACDQTDEAAVRQRCAELEQTLRTAPGETRSPDEKPSADRAVPHRADPPASRTAGREPMEPRPLTTPVSPLLIRLLGPLRVEGTGGALPRERLRPKEQRVLARLALEPGQLVPRDELLELFWPHSHPRAAERSLRTVVSSLRAGLRTALTGQAPPLITGRMEGYCLEVAACAVDVAMFTAAVQEARAVAEEAPERALTSWRRAVDLYDGDLLSNFPYDDWCLGLRERLRVNLLDGLYRLARAALLAEALEEARDLALRMVGLDPAEERAYRLLMRCYARMGSPGEAVRQFERCRVALWEELGAQPAHATHSLYETIRNGAASDAEASGDLLFDADEETMAGHPWADVSPRGYGR